MSKITEEQIVIFYLAKYGKDRGYVLSEEELKKLVPHSDEEMEQAVKEWRKKNDD